MKKSLPPVGALAGGKLRWLATSHLMTAAACDPWIDNTRPQLRTP